MSSSFQPPEPGTLVAGKYRVAKAIASGGMGVVLEAEHEALGQRVAIKLLLPEAAAQPELVERFLREARAAARIQSDHVVRVFDIGTNDDGTPFMVMERLVGHDLGDEITRRGPLPVEEAVGYVLQALEGIVLAHELGIIHRDLKPSNLFLTERGGAPRVKVLDFGISKIAVENAPVNAALTSTKSMLGSPGYMSPEQVRSTKSVDARTDVWALGVILYELLTGVPAFLGETLGDIFAKIREEDLPPIRALRPDVPAELEQVLIRCLRRDRAQRIPDARSLAAALEPFASRGSARSGLTVSQGGSVRSPAAEAETMVATAPVDTPSPAIDRVGSETLATWSGEHGGKGRGRAALLVAGVVLAGGGAAGLWAFLSRSSPTSSTSTSAAAVSQVAAPSLAPSQAITAAPTVTPSEAPTASAAPAASASAPSVVATSAAPRASARPRGDAPPPSPTGAHPAPPPKKKDDLGI